MTRLAASKLGSVFVLAYATFLLISEAIVACEAQLMPPVDVFAHCHGVVESS